MAPGAFTMGTDLWAWWDAPRTQAVTLSGYWIYKYEVTVAQYRAFCAATSRALPTFPSGLSWAGKSGWTDAALQQHPIVNVSWEDAKAYADWAGVSLPTEAQWEFASHGVSGSNYPWGGVESPGDPTNGWDAANCANWFNSQNQSISTWPVGSFPAGASWCGAHDMSGNVGEWCADWYGVYSATPVVDPTGPATGSQRIVRWGTWESSVASEFRGAHRGSVGPDQTHTELGFRCVSNKPGP